MTETQHRAGNSPFSEYTGLLHMGVAGTPALPTIQIDSRGSGWGGGGVGPGIHDSLKSLAYYSSH